ncbi:MAG TPA: hypothetical protein DEP76_00280 [Alteromonas sp.]|nr:hypothetical protein [Alteromonas sp.]
MIAVISGMIILLFVLVGIQLSITRKQQKENFRVTLKLVAIIKRIIGLSQKHRGLTATDLQGNQTVADERTKSGATLSCSLVTLTRLA